MGQSERADVSIFKYVSLSLFLCLFLVFLLHSVLQIAEAVERASEIAHAEKEEKRKTESISALTGSLGLPAPSSSASS